MKQDFSKENLKLTDSDLKEIYNCRGKHNKLGFAYQICFVKINNYFPKQRPLEIINEILNLISLKLDIEISLIFEYQKHREHIARHQKQIKAYLKLKSFGKKESDQLCEFLFETSKQIEQSSILYLKANSYLREERILKPSDDTINRIVGTQKERARCFIFEKVNNLLSDKVITNLENLIKVEDDSNFSKLYQIKRPIGKPSVSSMLVLANNLLYVKNIGVLNIDLNWLNNNYQRILTKYCKNCSANRLRKLEPIHRYTVLICFLKQTYQDNIDHMIDIHSKLTTKIYNGAETELKQHMQKKQKTIKIAVNGFRDLSAIILDESIIDIDLRKEIFAKIPKAELTNRVDETQELLSGKYSDKFNLVTKKFSYLRQFFPTFLEHINFTPANSDSKIIEAIDLLKKMNKENKRKLPEDDVPIDFVPKKVLPLIQKPDTNTIDKQGWECALMTKINKEIKIGNLSVKGSKRFDEFDKFFTPKAEWELKRRHFFERAELPINKKETKEYLTARINKAYDYFFDQESKNKYATIENDKWVLSVDQAEQLSNKEKADLKKLKSWLSRNIRTIKLPELLIEVDNELHFTDHFLPLGKTERNTEDVCMIIATIMALGCNIGAYTMAKLTNNISYHQIKRVIDWQLSEESLRATLAKIVNAISNLQVTKVWGEGKTSSSDGQHFKYNRNSIHKTYKTRFREFAIEFYTFVADNFAPYYSEPIECFNRDSSYLLDGILYNESDLELEEHYTDTHGYTELNFAAFAMIGKKFSPRIRNIKKQLIYRVDTQKDYKKLTPLVCRKDRTIDLDIITDQWDKIGHFYSSLESGHTTASTAMKRLIGFGANNYFYKANRELGRIIKTEHILTTLSDPIKRKMTRRGLLKGEQIHQLARDVSYAKQGKIIARDLAEQKNTCSSLTLIMACIIYWQSKEITRIIKECNPESEGINLDMLEHISPIEWENIILYGEYIINRNSVK